MTAPGEEWITTPGAARLLGLQLRTVRGLIERGELPAKVSQSAGGARWTYRVLRRDIEHYIEQARLKPGELAHLYDSTPPA